MNAQLISEVPQTRDDETNLYCFVNWTHERRIKELEAAMEGQKENRTQLVMNLILAEAKVEYLSRQ